MASKIQLEDGSFIDLEDGSGDDLLKEEDGLVPDAITSVTTVIEPNVTVTAISRTPDVITSLATVITPPVDAGEVIFTPDVISSAASVVTPTVSLAALVFTPPVVSSITSVVAPSMTTGGVTLTPDVITSATTVLTASVLTGEILTPPPIQVFAEVITPPAFKTGVTITPDVITASTAVIEPSLLSGLILTPDVIVSVTSVIEPTLVGGGGGAGVTFTMPVIIVTTQVGPPTMMVDGEIIFSPDVITVATTVIPPTLSSGLTLTVPIITVITEVIPPTVIRGAVSFEGHNEGRRQIVVDQQQGGTQYPFLYASDDLGLLIGDLYLNYKDDGCIYTPPFKIEWLVGFGTEIAVNPVGRPHEYDMTITDTDGTVIFDSRDADHFTRVDWGNVDGEYLRALEWVDDDTGEILRVVVFTAWSEDGVTPRDWPIYFEPEEAIIDPRTTERIPPFVSSLAVITNLSDESLDTDIDAGQNIILRGGYNAALTLLDEDDGVENLDGQPNVQHVQLDLDPGLGLGRFPCEELLYVKRINGVEPDLNGNIILDATGCYRVERPIFEGEDGPEVTHNTIRVANDCGPCCDCDDFIAVYEAIRRLSNRYKELALRAEAVRDQFRVNKARWLASSVCREGTKLRVIAEPVAPCKIAFAIGFCNTTDGPLTDIELRICFAYGPDSTGITAVSTIAGCILCDSTTRKGNLLPGANSGNHTKKYTLEGAWPRYSARFDCINPGTMGIITFIMEFPGCSSEDIVEFVVCAYGVNTGGAIPLKTSVSLLDTVADGTCCVSESSVDMGDGDEQCG